jgi:histidinol-phosphate/aromatic aminotransferase/cobyric acid decarboxylase-like protein
MYLRTMADKIGLDESYVRIAVRTEDENNNCLKALRPFITK